MAKLTNKQERFVNEYCIDCNATRAALSAGYSENTAAEIGYENLGKPQIAKLIRERLLEMAARAEITAGSVLRELALIAFADLSQYSTIDEDGNVRMDFRNMGPDAMRAVKKMKQRVEMTGDPNDSMPILHTEFELYDKQVALDKLMRYMGLYAKDNKQEITGSLEVKQIIDVPPRPEGIDDWLAVKNKMQAAATNRIARELEDA